MNEDHAKHSVPCRSYPIDDHNVMPCMSKRAREFSNSGVSKSSYHSPRMSGIVDT